MKYEEFKQWCYQRIVDGYWCREDAIHCLNLITEFEKMSFFKRRKAWKEEGPITFKEIVEPINKKIEIVNGNISLQKEIAKKYDFIVYNFKLGKEEE